MMILLLLVLLLVSLSPLVVVVVSAGRTHARNCHGSWRHVTLSVGADPATSMIVTFASTTPADPEAAMKGDLVPPIGGVLIAKRRRHQHEEEEDSVVFDRAVMEEEPADWYNATEWHNNGEAYLYTSPYYHHVLIDDLEPDTHYVYQLVTTATTTEFAALQDEISQQSKQQQQEDESIAQQVQEEFQGEATTKVASPSEGEIPYEDEEGFRRRMQERHAMEDDYNRRRRRRLLPPYDSTQCACPDPTKLRYFRTAPPPGHTHHDKNTKLAVLGDIGQFAHSEETLAHLRHHHGIGVADVILLAGDLAYPEWLHIRWDTFLDFWDDYSPLVDHIPLQITSGNHDVEKADHNGILFQAYEKRFRMPRIAPPMLGEYLEEDGRMNMDNPPYPLPYDYGNAYYGFVYGTAHVIVLSSYSNVHEGGLQYQWFVDELEQKVDRTVTPWLFVMMHCPIYNTFQKHQRDRQVLAAREQLEPLFVAHRVNMVFNGHVHAYMRSAPVAFNNLTETGPIHVIMGAGGRDADAPFLHLEPEPWVEVRDASMYGYGMVELYNATHMRWDWVHTGIADRGDYNLAKDDGDVHLPPGGVDGVVIENQWFL